MIDYDRIELEPAPNPFFDDGGTPNPVQLSEQSLPAQSTSARELAYSHRAARYEAGMPEQYSRIHFGTGKHAEHPYHPVQLPGQNVTVVYDSTLNRQLLQIYIIHGWAGIEAVQVALKQASNSYLTGRQHPWEYAAAFFAFTRNQIVLSIRESLIEIERKAADRLVLELSLSARLVNEVWTKLGIQSSTTNAKGETENVRTGETSPSWDTPVTTKRTFYSFSNTGMATRLFTLVHRAVQARVDLAGLREARSGKSGMLDPVHEDWLTVDEVATLLKEIADLDREIARMEDAITVLFEDVNAECPLAVLAVPLLGMPLDRPTMEQAIGECLAQFFGESERIAAAHARGDRVAMLIHGEESGRSLETLYSMSFAPERTVVAAVLDGALGDMGLLALMCQEILQSMSRDGQVPFDSFEYVVLMHYVTVLQQGLIDEQENAEALERVVARVSALLSLALTASPPTRLVTTLASVLTVSVLTYYTYSTVHHLAILDRQLGKQLVELDRQSAAEMVALAEVAQMRPTFLKEVSVTILKEIALIVAAGAVPQFHHLLHVRGFYLDLETLIGV